MLPERISTSLKKHALVSPAAHVLVGVSGGADSVALLYGLCAIASRWQLRLSVAHLNHGIRSDAAADAAFVATLCRQLGVAFYSEHVDVPALAANTGVSLEMAGRTARYRFFADMVSTHKATCVATAHTRDDQAETLLLKLCRGAGGTGLTGIARNTTIEGVRVIRPLLDVTRADIERFLRDHHRSWREDHTNADTQLKRNRIRHDIIPPLEQHLNPRLKDALARTADILTDENAYLAAATQEALASAHADDGSLQIVALCRMPIAIQRRMLRLWLIQHGISTPVLRFDLVERIATLAAGDSGTGCITISANRQVQRNYGRLRVAKTTDVSIPAIPDTPLTIPGETLLETVGLRITATAQTGFDRTTAGPIGNLPSAACIRWDNALPPPPLHVRSWKAGDRIAPVGLAGSRKLQDCFVDAKVPRDKRPLIPVITCHDTPVWVPGYRISQQWAVQNAKQRSLRLHISRR